MKLRDGLKKLRLKKVHIVFIFTAALTIYGLAFSGAGAASAAEPGSDADPIVSKSYVDAKINELLVRLNVQNVQINELTEKNKQLSDSLAQAEAAIQELKGGNSGRAQLFEVLELTMGQSLICGAGTEVILRGGKATAIISQDGGLADLTAGTEIKSALDIPLQHLLLISRDDGRGLKVTADKAWIMVKGSYEIK